jgi:hypothetical protein
MLPPHIVEREDRKTLDLLRFAMEQRGVSPRAWAAAMSRNDLPPVDDALCLFFENGRWIASYTERGTWKEIASFPRSFDAVKFVFAEFTNGPSPYDYREDWEAASGQRFSMVE